MMEATIIILTLLFIACMLPGRTKKKGKRQEGSKKASYITIDNSILLRGKN